MLPEPSFRFFADIAVEVATPIDVGVVDGARRRVVAITGGQAAGDGWRARVLPAGADHQRIVDDTTSELDARYVLETDAGDRIYVVNRAVRTAAPEVMARLMRGEPVDPAQVYFRCTPRLQCASPALAWIGRRIFVGTGARRPDRVEMRFHEML